MRGVRIGEWVDVCVGGYVKEGECEGVTRRECVSMEYVFLCVGYISFLLLSLMILAKTFLNSMS